MFVIVDSFGDDSAHKLEVVQVIWVVMTETVAHVRDLVPGGSGEESVVRVENLPSDDLVPLPQQTASVLPLFSLEYHVQSALQFLRRSPVQLSEAFLEHVLASDPDGDVFSSANSFTSKG